MYIAGFTFNMMSLMALSLVIGILIDDAVVVRENIFRHMEMGKDPMTAARNGTAEIGLAVMATTFTILAVFLPVGFMTGIVGQFFKQFALTIAFAVAMSLLVAFTLDPMLSSRFVRFIPPEERRRTRIGRFLEGWGAFYDRIDQRYHRILGWAVDHPWSVVAWPWSCSSSSLSTLTVHRHRVRAGRGPRPDGGPGRAAARARRSSRARRRSPTSSRSSAAFPRCGRSSPPSASTATPCAPASRSR